MPNQVELAGIFTFPTTSLTVHHVVTPMQVAQASLLHRSPNIMLIAGTSRRTHLRENLSVGNLRLSPEVMKSSTPSAPQRSKQLVIVAYQESAT